MKKVAFIDRDGTLIVGPTFIGPDSELYEEILRIDQLTILPDVFQGLRTLQDASYELVMVTNQDGLGEAHFPREKFDLVQAEFIKRCAEEGIEFAHVFICPHRKSKACSCRKPALGMVLSYLEETPIDRSLSVVIGDRDSDAEFARNVGVRFFRAIQDEGFPIQALNLFLYSPTSFYAGK